MTYVMKTGFKIRYTCSFNRDWLVSDALPFVKKSNHRLFNLAKVECLVRAWGDFWPLISSAETYLVEAKIPELLLRLTEAKT